MNPSLETATEFLREAKAQIDRGDHAAANDYLDSASRMFRQGARAAKLEALGQHAAAVTAEAGPLAKWRALLAFACGTGGGTPDHRALLNILQTAPDFDPMASISDRRRTDFFNWHTANRAEIRRLQNKILDTL